jgi:hypothetical protein
MLFRLAFYLGKLGLPGVALVVIGAFLSPAWAGLVVGAGFALVMTALFAWCGLIRFSMADRCLRCPLCGTPGPVDAFLRLRPTLACPRCGYVAGNFLTGFTFQVDCPEDRTQDWRRDPNLELRFAFDRPALNGVGLGERFDRLAALGPVEDKCALVLDEYSYPSLGVLVSTSAGETVEGFTLTWQGGPGSRPFAGVCVLGGQEVPLSSDATEAQFIEVFGPPYWRKGCAEDESPSRASTLFYVFREAAWEVTFAEAGTLEAIEVSRESLLANPTIREVYGVTSPWPPPPAGPPGSPR